MLAMDYPEAEKLIGELFGDGPVARHSHAVSVKAREIAEKIKANNHAVDVDHVTVAALLHDIGRTRTHCKKHAVESGEILREMGYPKLAKTAERHAFYTVKDLDIKHLSLEEKIVFYADKLADEDIYVTVEERFNKLLDRRRKYEKHGEIPLIESMYETTKEIERELMSLL